MTIMRRGGGESYRSLQVEVAGQEEREAIQGNTYDYIDFRFLPSFRFQFFIKYCKMTDTNIIVTMRGGELH